MSSFKALYVDDPTSSEFGIGETTGSLYVRSANNPKKAIVIVSSIYTVGREIHDVGISWYKKGTKLEVTT